MPENIRIGKTRQMKLYRPICLSGI